MILYFFELKVKIDGAREGQCSDIQLPDIMPLGHLIPRDRPGWVAGVMMGGAPGWCQHPALGGNHEK